MVSSSEHIYVDVFLFFFFNFQVCNCLSYTREGLSCIFELLDLMAKSYACH